MLFDVDFGCFEFQKNFYKKYILIRTKWISVNDKSDK